MRFKFLLIFLFCAMGILQAQDTIRTLIISEARFDNQHAAYVELTNVGSTTLDLSQFEFGVIGAWTVPYLAGNGGWFMLPKKNLAPGKSFVMAKVNDFVTKMWAKFPDRYNRYESKPEFLTLADVQIHVSESPTAVPQSLDSTSVYRNVVGVWNGRDCWYVRHHFMKADGITRDSVVVDQVGGVFDEAGGTNYDHPYDVAGFLNATGNAVLVRKSTVTKGNLDFATARGTNADESEWMTVPFLLGGWEPGRAVFWSTGNHGNYKLSSLTSSIMTVNWTDSTLIVPWGVRNDDSIIYKFNRVPGIAWHYDYAKSHADSAYVSVRTGDKLTVYACGDKLEKVVLKITALAPTASDNKVIPKYVPNNKGFYPGAAAFCEVSDNVPGMDTISAIAYACRVDTLLKYLEKPASASWEFVWVDGIARADLKKGDILKVTSANATVKQYYIKPNRYFPSHNAYLSSITFPDLPVFYQGILGWLGDTIPNFLPSKKDYKVSIPFDVEGMPALVGKQQQLNSKLQVTKALNLTGGTADRTVTFTNTAEDDTSVAVYKVELEKELGLDKIQQWAGEPFISQFIFKQAYNNDFVEIMNPGTDVIDLSNYMVTFGYYGSAAEAITRVSGTGDFANRYNKYIPGRKWVDAATWPSSPATAVTDASISPLVYPGDVFVMANIRTQPSWATDHPAFVIGQIDIDFNHNPWSDDLTAWGASMQQWWGEKVMLFKILNDSVKDGLKPANNPNDFELIDVVGDVGGSQLKIGGLNIDQCHQYVRKPNVFKGNPVFEGSFGTTEVNSEWIMMNEGRYAAKGYGWPATRLMVADGIGSHFMIDATIYRSKVSSNLYKVSDGFSDQESIKGMATGISVANFLTNIIKADTGQHLKVRKVADGSIISGTDVILTGDTLIVVSSDSVNTTKYILDVTLLSANATLTSATYTVAVNGSNGTVGNFAYGTDLKTVINGLTVPAGASYIVIDMKGAYVPMKILNFDTTYVNVKVSDQIQIVVTAENGTTKIVYQLQPIVTSSDAFVTSNVYNVNGTKSLIELIPKGTAVNGFLPNLIPATGASIKLLDKYGLERTFGGIFQDDKLLVTAANGEATKTYYLSMLDIVPNKYFAYVLSTVYTVDQAGLKITGSFTTSTKVSALIAALTPADFATFKCYNSIGVEKAGTENLAIGDVIKVTSGDGSAVVNYIVTIGTRVPTAINGAQINVYPNPSKGAVSVSGIESGSRICVYNSMGKLVMDKTALQSVEALSLNNQPQGVYFVKVVTKGKKDVSLKIVLK